MKRSLAVAMICLLLTPAGSGQQRRRPDPPVPPPPPTTPPPAPSAQFGQPLTGLSPALLALSNEGREGSRDRFNGLNAEDRARLLAFLRSL